MLELKKSAKKTRDGATFELFSPEVASIMKNMQKDGSTQANELMQAYQILHGYAAAQVEALNAGEWDDDESGDESGEESDEEIVKRHGGCPPADCATADAGERS